MLSSTRNISRFRKHAVPIFFILTSICLLYYNSLNNDFAFDDEQIAERTNLHLIKLDFESIKGTFYFTPKQNKIYRPLSCLTLGLNYYFGGDDPFGYHVVNIAIHIFCALAVYVFLYTLLSIPELKPHFAAKYRYEIAIIATFLFALHPLQVNVASYIIQRMTSLAALFYVISVTGYIQFRMAILPEKKQSTLKIGFGFLIFLIGGLFSALSKENAAFLPIMILILDYLLFYPLLSQNAQKRTRVVYTVVILFILIVISYVVPGYYFTSLKAYQHREFSMTERLLTEGRIFFFYLYLIFFPNQSVLNLNYDFPISKSLIVPPQTFISIFGIIFLIFLFFKLKKQRNLFSFAIAWYLGNLIIESTFIPLELIFEHRTYLPGILIYLLISFGIVYISKRLNKSYILVVFTSLILVLYSHGTYLRNLSFRTQTSLWLDIIEKSPKLARGYANLGKYYWETGYPLQAKSAYEKALELKPDMVEPMINLCLLNLDFTKDTDTALHLAKKALQTSPRDSRTPRILADVYMHLKNYKKAEHYYLLSLKRYYFNPGTKNSLGIAKIHLGKKKEAVRIFLSEIRKYPSYENSYLNLAKLYANENRYYEAINVLNRYLSKIGHSKKAILLLKNIKKKGAAYKKKQY